MDCKIADLCYNGYFSSMNESRFYVEVKLVKTQTMKRIVFRLAIAACLLCFFVCSAFPAPAWPHKVMYAQADGTSLAVYVQGDERLHYYVSEDDCVLLPDGKGSLRYAEVAADGRAVSTGMVAHAADVRSVAERLYVQSIDKARVIESLSSEYDDIRRGAAVKSAVEASVSGLPGEIAQTFPTVGNIRGLIILAEFTDKKFARDDIRDLYDDMANDENYAGPYASGSIKSYFKAQSCGKFVPEYDVVGPVVLPHDMAYYGLDERASELMIDACKAADTDTDVDFSQYDFNEDGKVDFVFVVYAGYGQAQGGPEETVWPQAVDLTYESWDMYDGLYLGQAACSCELRGYEGENMDGIGTFCHEFSHILGLPDIYDVAYSGMAGMVTWDVMCKGLYNDDSKTPAGYTAMDKYTVGWLEPVVLDAPAMNLTLKPFSESNEAYFIVCGADNNEYFTLENRQQTGWDKALGGHGLIISQIHYDKSLWNSNRVNTTSVGYEHVALIAADGHASEDTEAGDPFPGETGNTQYTDTSMPGARWHSTSAAVDCPITNIRENDGMITFDFKADATGLAMVESGGTVNVVVDGGAIVVDNPCGDTVTVVGIDGKIVQTSDLKNVVCRPGNGIYIVKCGDVSKKVILD